ncbi:MAG: pyruvate formate lyase family protein [Anaerolineae bacterium]
MPDETCFQLPDVWPLVDTQTLMERGEYLAAGFLRTDGSPLRRMAHGWRCHLENAVLPQWRGEVLYPAGRYSWFAQGSAVTFDYSFSMMVNRGEVTRRRSQGAPEQQGIYTLLDHALGKYPRSTDVLDPDLCLGGNNYTHSILNYGRLVREGLDEYSRRVCEHLLDARNNADAVRVDFYEALEDVLAGIHAAHQRALAALEAAKPGASDQLFTWQRLYDALLQTPWKPARTFYEALVGVNFVYYLDGCDNLGRFDQDLGALYEDDLQAERITEDEGTALVSAMWDNINANSGWNVAIGGCGVDGSSAANRLTIACLHAARNHRRPNLALRLTHETPEEVLDAALDSIASGCGIPALYNDEAYRSAVVKNELNIQPEDLSSLAFGGCTELMVHGCSNVGSLDAGLNLPLILTNTLRQHLATAGSFTEIWHTLETDIAATVERMARQVSQAQAKHARWQPQPIRTLLIDDCLERGIEFNAGGARYNWSVINVGGLGTVVDSLAAIREIVYERREMTGAAFWEALQANYVGYEGLRQRINRCPRYGNDDPHADSLAREVAGCVFGEMHRYIPWRGGRFLPGCLLFATYAQVGEGVMATPDGRLAGQAIADSIGAVAGRDRHGPTALIHSVASIPQQMAPGTLVTNFRFARSMFEGEGRSRIKELIRSYFHLGGMQMQITVVDQETLRAALAEPERYADLIVRIGGYSEYWINLSQSLRETVLERTEHAT